MNSGVTARRWKISFLQESGPCGDYPGEDFIPMSVWAVQLDSMGYSERRGKRKGDYGGIKERGRKKAEEVAARWEL